ncbi:hypothetical protein L249_5412 [Ophiocordyceps polyrhachis-furcata BCC 54312]|uniref:Mitochondrial thiamine pyrophosphate carrier 1 n=1 Tax=Ophiocordyceps polyrhachis-furcata BCC 54312 TaxID=1330021 RepID=A0A367L9A2_9HYPO|nr:hypothetical protein L249_5412 [Ophiocordyceps polyrhachis-furcata BCC 54312]
MPIMSAQSKPEVSPWSRAVAGAAGAVLANFLVYPLDIIKTRLQVQAGHGGLNSVGDDGVHYTSTWNAMSHIVAEDGIGGLYAGMNGSLIGVASTNFAYFYWYTIARSIYFRQPILRHSTPSMTMELVFGAVAGALAQIFTIPVAVVTTRQQTARRVERRSLFDTAREVVDGPDGVSGLWKGLKASLVLVVNPAITYGAYERLRNVLFQGKSTLKPWEAFFLGAMSKAIATLVTQPLIVAKVCLQSKPPLAMNGKPFRSFVDVIRFIAKHEGLPALFKGIGPQISKGLVVQGILMMIKERVEIYVLLLISHLHFTRKRYLQYATRLTSLLAWYCGTKVKTSKN